MNPYNGNNAPNSSSGNRFFASSRERFHWCLRELIEGRTLDEGSMRFVQEYRTGDEYAQEKEYWATYEKFGGLT